MSDEGSVPPPAPEPTPAADSVAPEIEIPEAEPLPPPVPPESMLTDAEVISVSPLGKMESSEGEMAVPEPVPVSVESLEPQPVPPPEPPQESPHADSVPAASPAAPPPPVATSSQPKPSARERMLTVVRARKAERLEKIVALARERKIITNDDVEMLLKVSNATTTRYLNALVVAGRLRRFGARKHEKYEIV